MMETNLLSQVDAIDRFWKLIFVLESMGKKRMFLIWKRRHSDIIELI